MAEQVPQCEGDEPGPLPVFLPLHGGPAQFEVITYSKNISP